MSIDYPAAPWHLLGRFWAGVFAAERPLTLPARLQHVLDPRWVVVALVRYRDGTLRYDELVVGSLARRELRVGLFVHSIWVDNLASVAGGRAIWGLPKKPASFDWEGDRVRVADATGGIATIRIARDISALPPLWLPLVGIGRRAEQWAFFTVRLWACLGRSIMRLEASPGHFPYRLSQAPFFSIAACPFRATFPPPRLLSDRP